MDPIVIAFGGFCSLLCASGLVMIFLISRMRRFVEQGTALIVTGAGPEPQVHFTSAIVLPLRHRCEVMDISLRQIEIEPGVFSTKDEVEVEMRASFFVHVVKSPEAVIRVAQTIGAERASDPAVVTQLFRAKFTDALKVAGRQLTFAELDMQRERFYEQVLNLIGPDLNGFRLEDVVIESLKKSGEKQ